MTISENVEPNEIPVIPEGEKKKRPGLFSRLKTKLGNLPLLSPLARKAGGVKNFKQLQVLTKPIFIVPAFIIIYVGFGMAYQSKQTEYDDLQPQIAAQQKALSVPASTTNLEGLQVQLSDAQAELERVQSSLQALALPTPAQNIDIYNEIVDFGAANSQPVQITSIKASGLVMSKKGQQDTMSYTVSVDGSRTALLDFIARLISSQDLLHGMAITRINLADKEEFQTLTLDLSILAQPQAISKDTTTP
ncbi:MAG: hypothetical protein PHV74_06225 [Dehalococcoidia bacterium]|nr:hypothetical protein [Dehalococcoidia bacterium]